MEEFARVRLAWLRTFLTLRGGVPSHDTFNRVFQALDPKSSRTVSPLDAERAHGPGR